MSTESTQLFDYAPTVELLRSFLPDKAVLSEEDALKKAWRIYVYLKTIYGNGITLGQGKYISSSLALNDTNYKFSFCEWLGQLEICFSNSSSKLFNDFLADKKQGGKQKKAEENINLIQKITIKEIWQNIFNTPEEREEWIYSFKQFHKVSDHKINDLLKLHPFDSQGSDFINCTRPYRLDFQKNLANSSEPRWIRPIHDSNQKLSGNYLKLESWLHLIPNSLQKDNNEDFRTEVNAEYISNEDLADFITTFANHSNNRLLFAAEFIMSANITRSKYNTIVTTLEKNWLQPDNIKPIKLTYQKFPNSQSITTIIYPVIFYYIKRGPYLYAVQTIESHDEIYSWDSYRLDRILDVETLNWDNKQIPENLRTLKHQGKLPTPEEVEDFLYTDTLGHTFWKPQRMMFVRFNRSHYSKYIQDTSRQEIFQEVKIANLEDIDYQLNKFFNEKEIYLILESLQEQLKEEYAFCIAKFYEEDIDVFLRILSWGKNVKVILPIELKENILQEIQLTLENYQLH